jgi:small-conductance mechanosensitive channel
VASQPDAKPNPTHPDKDESPRRGHDGHDKPDSANSNPSSNPLPPDTQPAASQPPQRSAQEIREAHDRYMNLDARAQAALEGVQQIRSQQQSQGLDIRGDILASTSRVRNLMTEANSALSRNDLEAANDYLERADHEVAALEKFLGR